MKKKVNRRNFMKTASGLTAGYMFLPTALRAGNKSTQGNAIRLGGPVPGKLKNIPFMLEHINSQEDYKLAADYVSETGKKAGVLFAEI
jgi:hypothetical protein